MSDDRLAILGGQPASPTPLHIVRPRTHAIEEITRAIGKVLAGGIVTNHGPHVQAFEDALSAYFGVPALAFVNGQTAIMAMLRGAGIRGGEVIVPSFTFGATPHAVRWCGAEPVFADSKADDLTLDVGDLERRLTARTVAVLGVDTYGIPCDYEELAAFGHAHGLTVVFDSAPAFGARYRDTSVGGFGNAQAFSFHATKAFSTMEGGAVASRDEDLLRRVRALRNFGQAGGPDCEEAGLNGKLTEVCALVGLHNLPGFDAAQAQRKRIAQRYARHLEGLPGLELVHVAADKEPVWLYFPVSLDPSQFGLTREQTVEVLARENLFVRKYYELPCHHMRAYAAQRMVALPVAERWGHSTVALPVYNDMTPEECDCFTNVLRRIPDQAAYIRKQMGW